MLLKTVVLLGSVCVCDDDGDVWVLWCEKAQRLQVEWQVFSEGRLRAQDLMQYELRALRL